MTPPIQIRRGRKHHAKGVEYARENRWRQALHEFEEAARRAPHEPNFHYSHGVALCHFNRFAEAIKAFERELAVIPEHGSALTELGACFARIGRTREGISYLRKGLKLMPYLPQAQFNLGLALLTESRRQEAIEACDRAIELDANYADVYRLRGLAYAMSDEDEKSFHDLRIAAVLDNKNYDILVKLGTQNSEKSNLPQASRLLEVAAKVAPKMALAQYAWGHFLIGHRMYELGLSFVDRAIELDPLQWAPYLARALGFLGQGRIEEAMGCYRRASEIAPDNIDVAGAPLFTLQHKPGVTEADLLQAHKKWGKLAQPHASKDRLSFTNNPDPQRKPRIGLVSGDMHRHAVAFLTLRAFEQLATLGYEIFCYKTDPKRRDDDFSERYKAFAKSWHDISELNDTELAELIAEQEIDILFDLAGHTSGNRLSLFAMRAAPIQLTWAGYVGTVGLDTYDGIIADPVEIPLEHDSFYLEPVIRLPDCYVCYHPPTQEVDVGPLPYTKTGTFTFSCFNRPAKLNSEVARAWSKILEQVPNARILMVYGGLGEASTQEAIYKVLESGGLARERVELVGETNQLKLLEAYAERVDLALDPFPYSGGVTTLEAMWMGVPTITCVGDTFAGRHSASHLTAAGLADFCTPTVEAYINLAVEWTKRPHELAALRASLRDKVAASPLNNHVLFGHHLDEALTQLWREWCMVRIAKSDLEI
nr:glycosyltransferase family 41 protein [Beijerinckia indica]